jgi:hypothetical protein
MQYMRISIMTGSLTWPTWYTLATPTQNTAAGFGLSANYRRFSVSGQFIYRVGFDIVNEIAMQTEGMLDKNNQSMAVLKRWRNEGNDYPGNVAKVIS